MTMDIPEPPLDKAKHVRYFQRCFRSLLPHHYTSTDSARLMLGFFIIAGLDLLSSDSPEPPLLTSADRVRLREWILSHQHPSGGFCGSPHHVLPRRHQTNFAIEDEVDVAKDPANAHIYATYFGLLGLGILAEGDGFHAFEDIDRMRTLRWLKKLQRPDGSFGEVITEDGYIAGGRDMRYCYIAATIRWVLGGAEKGGSDDIDVDALVAHIRKGQTFDGGVAESSTHESHSGYAYCAVACLSMLDYANPDRTAAPDHYIRAGIPSVPSLIHFLVSRQFAYLDDSSSTTSDDDGDDDEREPPSLEPLCLDDPTHTVGFNGRLNKVADTCYTWWVCGALALLAERSLVDRVPARRFILDKTQHLIGGFAKHPGGPPDIYHAYLGLAALGTMAGDEGEDGIGRFDARLCVSESAARRIGKAREGFLAHEDASSTHNDENEVEEAAGDKGQDSNLQKSLEEARKISATLKTEGKRAVVEMDHWGPYGRG
ncbi:terpenoid cyclases/Protein prenyltransferase [Xylariaceae sp. FL0016]|nr:terpenoid cyclases/Protein prenyltransferase [Xylariaceae sp. FL0016]